MRIAADLHIHGLYSGAVSSDMTPKVIAKQAQLKGLQLVATGDALHPGWLKLLKAQLRQEGQLLFAENGTAFVLQAEVEDSSRVHHIIFFPSFSKAEELREELAKANPDVLQSGRPRLRITAEELAELCIAAGCPFGFSHAFTPYFGLYSKFDSYRLCYGSKWKDVTFAELGLSADTAMADRIKELHSLTFLSNSDAHSPWPNKLGREFNVFEIKELSFSDLIAALGRKSGRIALNVKFDPREGKYHTTRCRGCLKFYSPKVAAGLGWKCPCGNAIKKGVDFRIEELADVAPGVHPEHRPPCLHIIPLSELIALALKAKSPQSPQVQRLWHAAIEAFGNEIDVLVNLEIDQIAKLDSEVAKYVDYFRKGKIGYIPGGAGVYGKLLAPDQAQVQTKSLADFEEKR